MKQRMGVKKVGCVDGNPIGARFRTPESTRHSGDSSSWRSVGKDRTLKGNQYSCKAILSWWVMNCRAGPSSDSSVNLKVHSTVSSIGFPSETDRDNAAQFGLWEELSHNNVHGFTLELFGRNMQGFCLFFFFRQLARYLVSGILQTQEQT